MSTSASHSKRPGALGLLRPFFAYFGPYRIRLIPVALACALEVLFNAQIPLSIKFMIDKALIAKDQRMMVWILGALAVGTVVVSISSLQRGLAVAISWGLQPLMDLILLTTLVFALEWRLAAIGFFLCSLCVA